MGHREDGGKTFGPGHDGWYIVTKLDGSVPKPPEMNRYKAKSAFSAAQQAGLSLTDARVYPITCPECIYELEHGDVGPYDHHTCEEDSE